MGGGGESLLQHHSTASEGSIPAPNRFQVQQNPIEASVLALFAYHSNKSAVNLVMARGS